MVIVNVKTNFVLNVYAAPGACREAADFLSRPFASAGGGYSKRQIYLSFTIAQRPLIKWDSQDCRRGNWKSCCRVFCSNGFIRTGGSRYSCSRREASPLGLFPRACRPHRQGSADPFSLKTLHWRVFRALEPLKTVHWTVFRALDVPVPFDLPLAIPPTPRQIRISFHPIPLIIASFPDFVNTRRHSFLIPDSSFVSISFRPPQTAPSRWPGARRPAGPRGWGR